MRTTSSLPDAKSNPGSSLSVTTRNSTPGASRASRAMTPGKSTSSG